MASVGPIDQNWVPPVFTQQHSEPEQIRALMQLWDKGILNKMEFDNYLLRIANKEIPCLGG